MEKPIVILRHCDQYDPQRIAQIIGEGMDELGVRPHGRTMVKPNVVIAHKEFFPHAFTRPEFLDGLLTAIQQRGEKVSELYVGERCGITIPTRFSFAMAGYLKVLKKHGVRAEYFDEGKQVRFDLKNPAALRKFIRIPEGVARCEFLVNAPKFKAHPWTKVTFALKNYIGIQNDSQRLIDHDHMLHNKIADLQEVISPGFIALDAIIAGEKTMLTPTPFPLHMIIMGINPVAVDAVCTTIVGLQPESVDYLRMSAERGYGPLELENIDIRGDVTLEAACQRAKKLELTLDRIENIYNNKSNLSIYMGPPPDTHDYCWGGCPGSLFEAMQIINAFQPGVTKQVKPLHFIIGAYKGEINAKKNESVIAMGDCTTWEGQVHGQDVKIPFLYTCREHLDPFHATSEDVVQKMIKVALNVIRHRKDPVIRVRGCPVSVAENVLYVSFLGKVTNPYLHPKILFAFIYYWFIANGLRTWRKLTK